MDFYRIKAQHDIQHCQNHRHVACVYGVRVWVPRKLNTNPLKCNCYQDPAALREFLLVKLINGEKATFQTPTFSRKRERTLEMLIKDLHEEYVHDTKMVSYCWRSDSVEWVSCICIANGFPRSNWMRDSNELINCHRVKLLMFMSEYSSDMFNYKRLTVFNKLYYTLVEF